MNLHLIPLDAEFLQEEETHFIVIHADQLIEEVEVVAEVCAKQFVKPVSPGRPFCPNAKLIVEAATLLLMKLPTSNQPSISAIEKAMQDLSNSSIEQLLYCARQAATQVRYLRSVAKGKDFDATNAFLVSPLWGRRMERTLAGQLLPAYIGYWNFLNYE